MNNMRVRGIIVLGIIAIVVLVLTIITRTSTPINGTNVPSGVAPVFDISAADLIYFVVVVLGIVAKQLLDSWYESRQFKIEVGYAVVAVLLAALVYVGISNQIPKAPITLASLCLVFQYGVGWQALVDVVGKQKAA